MKALVKDRNQLCIEKRALTKSLHTRLKEADEEQSALEKTLIKEKRVVVKSLSHEVKKFEQRNHDNDTTIKKSKQHNIRKDARIEHFKRKLMLVKERNRELSAALQAERSKSRLTIEKLIDDAECVMIEAQGLVHDAGQAAAREILESERRKASEELHRERQYNASQMTQRKSLNTLR